MMALSLALVCLCGLLAGFLLFRKIRFIAPNDYEQRKLNVTLIIPARNEEKNLPHLLSSIRASDTQPAEILVVDDESDDATAAIARRFGATVLSSKPKPDDWKGKPWACSQGAEHAASSLLLFLDADTYFVANGLQKLFGSYDTLTTGSALSVLPYHRMENLYEEFSLFFNLLLAAGAGGFSGFGQGRLFGQSLLIDKDLYCKSGGHGVVRQHVLENLHLAPMLLAVGGKTVTAGGRGVLEMRMFPDGMEQLCSSWKKGFADGAKATPAIVMVLSIVWLTGAMMPVVVGLAGLGVPRTEAAVLYVLYVLQVWILARKVGSYRGITALLYVVPLVFYFILFTQSLLQRGRGKTVVWKGRQV